MGFALIVEDSATERAIVTGYLKNAGVEVKIATTGEEALEKLNANLPDVIVLDVVLPGRSGFEICRELKSGDKTSQIPIIIYSTKNSEMDKFWGLKQGADVYLSKPVDQDEIVTAVKQFLA